MSDTQIKIPIRMKISLKLSQIYTFLCSIEICGGSDHARARNFNAHMKIY